MGFAVRSHMRKARNLLGHGNDFCPTKFFGQGIPFHMVAMFMTANYDFNIFKIKSQLFNGIPDGGYISLKVRINQNVTCIRGNKK